MTYNFALAEPSGGGLDAADILDGVERNLSLPASWYQNPAIYELERERVFGATWQYAGLTVDCDEPGTYLTTTVGDREFILVRDLEGMLRGFHNVCSHRGMTMLQGCGTAKLIRCPYHAFTFQLDGSLQRAPRMERMEGFDPGDFSLVEVAVDVWEPFIFLNPDRNATPLEHHLKGLPEYVEGMDIDLVGIARQADRTTLEIDFECNWKVLVENTLECWHCEVAHPGFRATVDLNKYNIAMLDYCSIQEAPMRPGGGPRRGSAPPLGEHAFAAAQKEDGLQYANFNWIFPNHYISIWPGPGGSFSMTRHLPLGPTTTKLLQVRFWSKDTPVEERQEVTRFVEQVALEDKYLCEGVQKGLRSGALQRGRFQLADYGLGEYALRHFDSLVAKLLLA